MARKFVRSNKPRLRLSSRGISNTATHYTQRHYKARRPSQPVLAQRAPLCLEVLTNWVKKPSKRMLARIMNDLQDKREELHAANPVHALETLENASATATPRKECLKWLHHSGATKKRRVIVNGKSVWRSIEEAESASFDRIAHEWCLQRFENVDGIDEQAEYLSELRHSLKIWHNLAHARRNLKADMDNWEILTMRYDRLIIECAAQM